MSPMFVEAGAIVAVAVVMVSAVTTLALRRSEAHRRDHARDVAHPRPPAGARTGAIVVGGVLAALPTWGGVLLTVVLLVRGKVALAAVAGVATIVHTGILRWRAGRLERPR